MLKRMLSFIIGVPIIAIILILGNEYTFDVVIAIVAIFALNEYYKAISSEAKPLEILGYILAILIAFIHIISIDVWGTILILLFPITFFVLFLCIICTNMKINFKDIAFNFFGIVYILSFLVFLPLIYSMSSGNLITGKYLIWIVLFITWGSDAIAYLVGHFFGKHKFSKVSPNKTIEGCIGGLLGAIILTLIYVIIINNVVGFSISYVAIILISAILAIIGQIGDFAASTIKRYFEIKDFGNVIPGHGGIIDRIDSLMFVAPFAYILFLLVL